MLKRIILMVMLGIPALVLAQGFAPVSGTETTADDLWSTWGGEVKIEFNRNMLKTMEIQLEGTVEKGPDYLVVKLPILAQSSLQFWAPQAAFDGFYDGALMTQGGFQLNRHGSTLDLRNLTIVPARDNLSLAIKDVQGQILFYLDHIHAYPEAQKGSVGLNNMDVRFSTQAAEIIGIPEAADMGIAVAHVQANLNIPGNGIPQGSCSTPRFPNGTTLFADVALINMSSVSSVNKTVGQVALAPSATLANIGNADVTWYEKFTTGTGGTYPAPYNRDQHPFLAWNMYRLLDGRMEQLGASGLKHAFFTVNTSCSCPGGHILWSKDNPGNSSGVACQDTYGVGNNNSSSAVGIREELAPNTASWEQCGSIFAPNGTAPGPCNEERFSISFSELERRLYVNDADLETPGAEYFVTAWYIVKDDINIFNTMGFRKVIPSFSGGSWFFNLDGGFVEGSATNQWIDPDNLGANQSSDMSSTSKGHVQLMSQVEDLGEGLFRYTYGLMNYDYSVGFTQMNIPYLGGLQSVDFDDADHDGANDWQQSIQGNNLIFAAPTPADHQPWYTLNSIVIEVQSPPLANQTITVKDGDGKSIMLQAFVPGVAEELFADGFESGM
ncbi:MAG: hypothetical protein ACWA5R_04690 [bacterium]